MFVSPEQMADLRQILEAGMAACLLLLFILNVPERQRPAVAVETCKLHQRPTSECRPLHEDPPQ